MDAQASGAFVTIAGNLAEGKSENGAHDRQETRKHQNALRLAQRPDRPRNAGGRQLSHDAGHAPLPGACVANVRFDRVFMAWIKDGASKNRGRGRRRMAAPAANRIRTDSISLHATACCIRSMKTRDGPRQHASAAETPTFGDAATAPTMATDTSVQAIEPVRETRPTSRCHCPASATRHAQRLIPQGMSLRIRLNGRHCLPASSAR